MERVLIISPHTDDAELGCGGFISKLVAEKKQIYWVVFSTAEDSLPDNLSADTLRNEFYSVAEHFSIKRDHTQVLNFPVRLLSDYRQQVLEILVRLRKEFAPDLVLTTSVNDLHQDHGVVVDETVRAFKNAASILSYELPYNHIRFESQFFIKLAEINVLEKIYVLQKYKSQLSLNKSYFNDKFIKSLARVRGAQINTEFAEAFEVIRWIV